MSVSRSLANETNSDDFSYILNGQQTLEDLNTKTFFKKFIVNFEKLLKQPGTSDIKQAFQDNKTSYFEVKVENNDLEALNSDLPLSGKNYVPARIKFDNNWEQAKLKYRGDNYYHWGFDKKSYTIKLGNDQKFNLINPKATAFIADDIAMTIAANDFTLLSPKHKWVGLFINDSFKGIYFFLQDLDDQFAQEHNLEFGIEGEKILFTATSGQELFYDSQKWNVSSGFIRNENKNQFDELLSSLHIQDYSTFFQFIDIDYMARFYAWVSFTLSSSYDSTHNWRFGFKEGRFYPIPWDPSAWLHLDNNKLEIMNSPIASFLRKNIYFNQLFSQTLWDYVASNSMEDIRQLIFDHKSELEKILPYDIYKGGAYSNPNGIRFPQNTQTTLEAIDNLEKGIIANIDIIQNKLKKTTVVYWEKDNYLYIDYTGKAGSYLESLYEDGSLFETLNDVEVFNNSQYVPLPKFLTNQKVLLVSGRTMGDDFYSSSCPLTYRIPVTQKAPFHITLRHSLTKELIIAQEEKKGFEISNCNMSFEVPQEENLSTTTYLTASTNDPVLYLTFDKIGVNNFLDFYAKAKEKIQFQVDAFFSKGNFKKASNSDLIEIKLDNYYHGTDKFFLTPRNAATDAYVEAQSYARKLGFPTPSINLLSVRVNDFDIGYYYLFEAHHKAFFEKNYLTFDTHIYKKNSFDTLNLNTWEKIATDSYADLNDKKNLEFFLDKIRHPNDLEKYIDLENFERFYSFLLQTGNENLDYLIYFDNTRGKYLFFPYYYSYYRSTNFTLRDPLIDNIFLYLKNNDYLTPENTIHPEKIQSIIAPAKFSLGPLTDLQYGNQIILEEKKKITIKNTVVIPSNLELIIKSGVEIEISKGASIISYGKVTAAGTENHPIIVKSKDKKPFGVFALIEKGAENSNFSYIYFQNGSESFYNNMYLSGMFSAYHVKNITIANSIFDGSQSDDGLNIKYATVSITDSTFKNNSADAIDLDFVNGEVKNNSFMNNGNDSIDVSYSDVTLQNNLIEKSGDKCISVGENSSALIQNNQLLQCYIGLEAKDLSEVTVTHNTFSQNIIALNAYQKKAFWGGAHINVTDSTFLQNSQTATLLNTFTETKFSTDDSSIEIINSLFEATEFAQLSQVLAENIKIMNSQVISNM